MAVRKSITLAFIVLLCSMFAHPAHSATWTTSTSKCPNNISTMMQLRDGRLLMQVGGGIGYWLLWSPDAFGSYQNGTCRRAADMPDGYAPRASGSLVATDGKAYIFGGEFNNQRQEWTNQSAVYDPVADTWTMIAPPQGWLHIGDAPALLLPNGRILQLNCCTNEAAEYNVGTQQWESPSTTLLAHNNEIMTVQTQTDRRVVMVDTQTNFYCGNNDLSTEVYDYVTHTWACGPPTPVKLWGLPDNETGIPTLLPDGRLFWTGGVPSVTAALDPAGTQWSLSVDPQGWNQDDAVSALLPDGTVLGAWRSADKLDCQFKVYDPAAGTLLDTANPSTCPGQGNVPSFRLTVVPTGQVAFAYDAHSLQFYSSGQAPLAAAGPHILALGALAFVPGGTHVLYGNQLNGVSCASFKDDDAQQCTNYPLVQVTDALGHVGYWPTFGDSYSGVQLGRISYTRFTVPVGMVPGVYAMRVVANGIASDPVQVVVVTGR